MKKSEQDKSGGKVWGMRCKFKVWGISYKYKYINILNDFYTIKKNMRDRNRQLSRKYKRLGDNIDKVIDV